MSDSEHKGILLGLCAFSPVVLVGASGRGPPRAGLGEAFLEEPMVIWRFASNAALDALCMRNDFLATLQQHAGSIIDIDAAKVVFTELVANVILHAPGPIAITLEFADSSATLTVADTGPGFLFAPALSCTPTSAGGRGLFLVSRYAAAVSVERLKGAGTSISAILALRILPVPC